MDDATVPPSAAPSVPDATDVASGPAAGAAADRASSVEAVRDPGVDPDLRQRAQALLAVPLDDRAAAFDDLNGDVAAALRAIEEL